MQIIGMAVPIRFLDLISLILKLFPTVHVFEYSVRDDENLQEQTSEPNMFRSPRKRGF